MLTLEIWEQLLLVHDTTITQYTAWCTKIYLERICIIIKVYTSTWLTTCCDEHGHLNERISFKKTNSTRENYFYQESHVVCNINSLLSRNKQESGMFNVTTCPTKMLLRQKQAYQQTASNDGSLFQNGMAFKSKSRLNMQEEVETINLYLRWQRIHEFKMAPLPRYKIKKTWMPTKWKYVNQLIS